MWLLNLFKRKGPMLNGWHILDFSNLAQRSEIHDFYIKKTKLCRKTGVLKLLSKIVLEDSFDKKLVMLVWVDLMLPTSTEDKYCVKVDVIEEVLFYSDGKMVGSIPCHFYDRFLNVYSPGNIKPPFYKELESKVQTFLNDNKEIVRPYLKKHQERLRINKILHDASK